jgi:hypothetical protein
VGFVGKLLPTPVDKIEFRFARLKARLDNQKRTIRKIMSLTRSLIKKRQLDKWLKTTPVSSFRFPSTKLKMDHTERLNYQRS